MTIRVTTRGNALAGTLPKTGTIVPMPPEWRMPGPHWHAVRFDHSGLIVPMEAGNFKIVDPQ